MSKAIGKRLGDIVNFKRGYDLPSRSRKDGMIPIISSGGISGYHSDYKAYGEGIVTGRYGTLGEVYYINGEYWPHNTTLYATNFYGNSPKYIYYLMKCLGNLQTSDKSTVPGINRNDLHEIIIPYLPPKIQRQIIPILSFLDNKIELNNRINAELEQMAKTLYDYWFVQFDFPNQDGKPYKSSGGKMVYDEVLKREIPKGWKVGTIHNVGDLLGGGTPRKDNPYFWNGSVPFFTPKDHENSFFVTETEEHITEMGLKNCSSKLYPKGTIFITARGTVGNINIASTNMAMNQSCYAVLPKPDINYCFLHQHCINLIQFMKGKAAGSVFDALVSNDFKQTSLVVPAKSLIDLFGETSVCFYEQMLNNRKQNQQLASLRDWLLPMLMNGQVSVGEINDNMEEISEERASNARQEQFQMHLFD
ncbi:restriction endonuclease subunit S [Dyadobacter sp. Leaf189]|uniref:restriction endonuclease subunit S n=1 Tax=Dyadobacter sp. Leaf189 TaxID=1736295 RepID=UPI0006F84076|nr:restriction endonuclease subunit S [Dyadobacter sp. Leaf189]KQS33835.1 hypothetical protein ASG33_07250 [Dyadobacter sp. Leaf189]